MFRRIIDILVHSALAVLACMVLGFIPEAFLGQLLYGTRLEPLMPGFTVISLLVGFFVTRKIAEPEAAMWIWVPWLFWFLVGFRELAGNWSPMWDSHLNRWTYAFDNLFGTTPNCSATECWYEILFTAPLLCAICYSIGAVFALKVSGKPRPPLIET